MSWSRQRLYAWHKSDLVKILDFLLLVFKYLFWNDVRTVTSSFSSLINTRSIFALQVKGKSRPRNLCYINNRGNVIWGTLRRRNVLSGNCSFGELSSGELPVREISSTNFPDSSEKSFGEKSIAKTSVGELSRYQPVIELCGYQPKFQPCFLKQNTW